MRVQSGPCLTWKHQVFASAKRLSPFSSSSSLCSSCFTFSFSSMALSSFFSSFSPSFPLLIFLFYYGSFLTSSFCTLSWLIFLLLGATGNPRSLPGNGKTTKPFGTRRESTCVACMFSKAECYMAITNDGPENYEMA